MVEKPVDFINVQDVEQRCYFEDSFRFDTTSPANEPFICLVPVSEK